MFSSTGQLCFVSFSYSCFFIAAEDRSKRSKSTSTAFELTCKGTGHPFKLSINLFCLCSNFFGLFYFWFSSWLINCRNRPKIAVVGGEYGGEGNWYKEALPHILNFIPFICYLRFVCGLLCFFGSFYFKWLLYLELRHSLIMKSFSSL